MEEKVKEIIQQYQGDKSYLVPILQDVQKEFNYLPKDALCAVSTHLSVPISRVYEVVTFYKAFSLVPKGRHEINVCMGTACHVRGAPRVRVLICTVSSPRGSLPSPPSRRKL